MSIRLHLYVNLEFVRRVTDVEIPSGTAAAVALWLPNQSDVPTYDP